MILDCGIVVNEREGYQQAIEASGSAKDDEGAMAARPPVNRR